MNRTAKTFSSALIEAFPRFAKNLKELSDGNFETFVPAPDGSKAGALVCFSTGDGDVWVRFSPPRAVYGVDTKQELLQVVGSLLKEEILFVVLSRARRWSGTTLVRRDGQPHVEAGESATVLSWTGKRDATVRSRKTRAHVPQRLETTKEGASVTTAQRAIAGGRGPRLRSEPRR